MLPSVKTLAALDNSAIEKLQATLVGQLITPDEAGYDTARKVYNAMIDRRPALIARCAGVADAVAPGSSQRDHAVVS